MEMKETILKTFAEVFGDAEGAKAYFAPGDRVFSGRPGTQQGSELDQLSQGSDLGFRREGHESDFRYGSAVER